jgi:NADPH2:quinone reductase
MPEMRAVTLSAPGEPGSFEVSSLPIPEPAPDEIRIKIVLAGVSEDDCLSRAGRDRLNNVGFPVILGREVVGVVDAVGSEVTEFERGARVMACVPGGGYAEFVVVEQSRAALLARGVEFGRAIAYGNDLWSAYLLYRKLAPIDAGSTLLIHSANGNIGSFLVQLGKADGCGVIALVGDEVGGEYCRALGADHVIERTTDENFSTAVHSATGGDGVDVVFNDRAGSTLAEDLKVLKFRGLWIVHQAADGLDDLGLVDVQKLTVQNPSMIPALPEAFIGRSEFREALQFQVSAAESGMFERAIHMFALDDVGRAHSELERGRLKGKFVLAVGAD